MPNKDESSQLIDIREDDLLALSAEVLDTLLRDMTMKRSAQIMITILRSCLI